MSHCVFSLQKLTAHASDRAALFVEMFEWVMWYKIDAEIKCVKTLG